MANCGFPALGDCPSRGDRSWCANPASPSREGYERVSRRKNELRHKRQRKGVPHLVFRTTISAREMELLGVAPLIHSYSKEFPVTIKLALLTTAFGCAIAPAAFAMPVNSLLPSDAAASLARVVCNENGRCWERGDDNPGAAILGGVVRGMEGRSLDRDGGDERRRRRGWDGDRRGEGYDRRWRHDDD